MRMRPACRRYSYVPAFRRANERMEAAPTAPGAVPCVTLMLCLALSVNVRGAQHALLRG
jgi:hypothetical protein